MEGGLSAGAPLEVCQGHLLQPHVLLEGVGGLWSHLKQKLNISQSLSKVHVRCSRFYYFITDWFHETFFFIFIHPFPFINWCKWGMMRRKKILTSITAVLND